MLLADLSVNSPTDIAAAIRSPFSREIPLRTACPGTPAVAATEATVGRVTAPDSRAISPAVRPGLRSGPRCVVLSNFSPCVSHGKLSRHQPTALPRHVGPQRPGRRPSSPYRVDLPHAKAWIRSRSTSFRQIQTSGLRHLTIVLQLDAATAQSHLASSVPSTDPSM